VPKQTSARCHNFQKISGACYGQCFLILEKRDRAPKRFSHHIGVMNVTHPSSTDIPDLLQRLTSLPIRAKQLKRQKEPLFTTLLRRFHIILVYGFLQFQKRE
jgi:hypothetical protein